MKSDSDLKHNVLKELMWDPLVPEARIGVAITAGVVTLSGQVDTYAQKVAARQAVERVLGVKAIALELEVIPPGAHHHSDTEIAAAVLHALNWDASVPAERIHVTVESGLVTLVGEVDWNYQRRELERLIHPLKGVVGINNNIRLKTMPLPANLSQRIKEALTRQARREARHIEVSLDGSVVTLRGHVHSWAERTAAEGTTWSAPGVNRVNNQLTVDA